MKNSDFKKINVVRMRNKITGDDSRVITRLNLPMEKDRVIRIIDRILGLSEEQVLEILAQVKSDFSSRHRDVLGIFRNHYQKIEELIPKTRQLSKERKELIGSYFTMEYSIESAALFNPSIVLHPNQRDLDSGSQRFIMSLRSTGEGHISSIVFRSGVLDLRNRICFDPVSRYVETPALQLDPLYNRKLFQMKLAEIGAFNEIARSLLDQLPESFTFKQLQQRIGIINKEAIFPPTERRELFEIVDWLAFSNYETNFQPSHRISERVIFPLSENESRGIEDARFVRFIDDDNEATYYATYTAYNGFKILPQLLETKDFLKFNIATLNGKAVHNKGMALFPRKINGYYVMLSRQGGENNSIMFSDNIHFWQEFKIIQEPCQPWEFFQIGNCGSPLETAEGWLVLTHGVGPVRQYCIGAILLDLENPQKMIAYLKEPLLTPHEREREGYVPNVVYTCGSIIHNEELVIPYAMSDLISGVATVKLDELLNAMERVY